jgi:hypothetical protein
MDMAFSKEVILKAWLRAKGNCECTRINHTNHTNKYCNQTLTWEHRGNDMLPGCWEAHHIVSEGPDTFYNSEILCCKCHVQTNSYGRHE